jgi:DNA-binding winged helix-turn-helix (wHTH) protein
MAPEVRSSTILRFGVFEVHLRSGELRKQGVRIKLQEQPFHVLTVLLQRPGEALGDSADNPRFIETLLRRGYRFIAPVTGMDGTTGGSAIGGRVAASTRNRKIVVTAAIAVLAAGIAGGLLWRAPHARLLTEKDTIVLGDFANSTGDTVFDGTLLV